MPDCNTCKAKKNPPNVPYVVHEGVMSRLERVIKRLWIALIVTIVLLVATNAMWIVYESKYECFETTQEVTQDTGEGSNCFIGGDCIGDADR